jgi:hypothetical protein
MATPVDIVHDLQMFMLSWSREFEHFTIMRDYLDKKYNITVSDESDEYYYAFSLNGIKYKWDWCNEELYFDGHENDDDDNDNSIISGPAYEYMREYDKAISTAYKNIESEMTYRGWLYDHDEYCHNLFKDGWTTDLSYWSGGCDFDDAVGEFYYEGDE